MAGKTIDGQGPGAIEVVGVNHAIADKTLQQRMCSVEPADHGAVWSEKVQYGFLLLCACVDHDWKRQQAPLFSRQ
jgi:hypothetical protein